MKMKLLDTYVGSDNKVASHYSRYDTPQKKQRWFIDCGLEGEMSDL